jgi:hypothetical protein
MARQLTTFAYIERGDDELEITVDYDATPFVDATYWQPAEGGEIEITAVTHDGMPITLTEAEESRVIDSCKEHFLEHQGDEAADYAEYRASQVRDNAWEDAR